MLAEVARILPKQNRLSSSEGLDQSYQIFGQRGRGRRSARANAELGVRPAEQQCSRLSLLSDPLSVTILAFANEGSFSRDERQAASGYRLRTAYCVPRTPKQFLSPVVRRRFLSDHKPKDNGTNHGREV